jgi:hypothetical protein
MGSVSTPDGDAHATVRTPRAGRAALSLVLLAALAGCGAGDRADRSAETSSSTPASAPSDAGDGPPATPGATDGEKSAAQEETDAGAGTAAPGGTADDGGDVHGGNGDGGNGYGGPATGPAAPGAGGSGSSGDTSVDGGSGTAAVSAVLVSAAVNRGTGVVELSGYVAGTVTEGQPCVYELRSGGDRRSVTTTSVADAAVTSCPWGELPLDQLGAGRWEARLAYPSEDVASPWVPVDVP